MPYSGSNLTAENTKPPADLFAVGAKGKYPLAVLLEGQFSDTFSTVPPWNPSDTAESGTATETPAGGVSPPAGWRAGVAGGKPGRLLVIGCSQAFNEDLLQISGNLNLFANAIDGLVLGDDLIQIRSKTAFVRDLKTLSTAEKLWYRFFTVLLVPILLFFAFLIRHFIRRKEKEFYLLAFRSTETA